MGRRLSPMGEAGAERHAAGCGFHQVVEGVARLLTVWSYLPVHICFRGRSSKRSVSTALWKPLELSARSARVSSYTTSTEKMRAFASPQVASGRILTAFAGRWRSRGILTNRW